MANRLAALDEETREVYFGIIETFRKRVFPSYSPETWRSAVLELIDAGFLEIAEEKRGREPGVVLRLTKSAKRSGFRLGTLQ